MDDASRDVSQTDAADAADAAALATLRSLPPLPEPNRWEQRSEACCGSSLVLALCGGFVAATRHMSSKIADHEVLRDIFVGAIHTEALVALICLLGLMFADPGVVQRTSGSSLPVPAQVKQVLEVGQSVAGLQNVVEGTDVYCVRCCVWRRRNSGNSSPVFCDDGLMENFHHCSTCQRCVANFDHHCGVFGRCIAGRGFGNYCHGDGWCCDLLCERCDGLDQTGRGIASCSGTFSLHYSDASWMLHSAVRLGQNRHAEICTSARHNLQNLHIVQNSLNSLVFIFAFLINLTSLVILKQTQSSSKPCFRILQKNDILPWIFPVIEGIGKFGENAENPKDKEVLAPDKL
eukprot:s3212_g16.t1